MNNSILTIMARPRVYSINDRYFEQPINEKQAYLLGLIYSDGHVSYTRGAFGYTCKLSDIELPSFIRNEFQSTHPLRFYSLKGHDYVRYAISCKPLVQSVITKYNMPFSNKSQNNLEIPNIPKEVMHHFLRGISDGDGSIWKSGSTFAFAFTGGKRFLEQIKAIIHNELGLKLRLRHRHGLENCNSCSIELHGSIQVAKLGRFLYKNSTIFLARKKKLFDLSEISAMQSFAYNGNNEKIQTMYKAGVTQTNIAKILHLNISSVKTAVQLFRRQGLIT